MPSIPRKRIELVRLDGRNMAVIGDLEAPDHKLAFLENVVETSQLFGIEDLLIAGDAVALDQTQLTAWAKEYYIQVEEGLPTVVDLMAALIMWPNRRCCQLGSEGNQLARAVEHSQPQSIKDTIRSTHAAFDQFQ